MKKYETRPQTGVTTYLAETTCDLCGAVATRGNWKSSSWEVNEVEVEVTVRQKDGSSYPEGGWGTELNVDICPDCFKDVLIPFLRSKGAMIEEKAWDF